MEGDNNDFLDPWEPTDDRVLGKAVLHLPKVGLVGSVLVSPITWVSLLLLAAALVIWPAKPEQPDDGKESADSGRAQAGELETAGRGTRDRGRDVGCIRHLRGSADMRAARAAGVGALAAVVSLGVGIAHASTLTVGASTLDVRSAGPCSTSTVALSPQPGDFFSWLFGYTQVRLTVPAACAGTALSVTVHATSGGAALATASADDVPAGTLTGSTWAAYGGVLTGRPAYSGAVTFDGWSVPASF